MTRKECLDKAAECVLKDRASQYGGVENNFARIAELWNVYLGPHAGIGIESHDVAAMMALLKIARVRSNPGHGDSWIDLAGYAACGAECASIAAEEAAEFEADHKFLESVFGKYKTEADAEPEFKPGDRVEVQAMTPRELWEPATVVEVVDGACRVEFADGYRQLRPLSYVRPVPKAEGCEELVQKDAPQTPAELCRRIVDCNPATYGHPHKPTGEELAELAELAEEEDKDA